MEQLLQPDESLNSLTLTDIESLIAQAKKHVLNNSCYTPEIKNNIKQWQICLTQDLHSKIRQLFSQLVKSGIGEVFIYVLW